MLKIGDFSKVAHVTIKTLRHYARIGLFQPAWTDRYTGYRYYNLQQLARLHRILALKDLGFSLDQVAELIQKDVPVEQLRGMLRRKQTELETRLRSEQNRLGMVAARLQLIELAGKAGSEVLIKRVDLIPVASLRATVAAVEQLPDKMAGLVDELNAWLAQSGIQAKGPWMALYQAAEYRERDIPIELAVAVPDLPVGPALTGPTRVTRRTLPGVEEMACLMHSGPVSTLGQAYAELYAWMEANKRRAAGPARELYLRDVSDDGHATQVIEVQLPLEPAYSTIKDLANHPKEFVMEPKIINLPAFNVAGLCYHGRNQNQEIAAMWGQFNQRAPELLPQTVPHTDAYGVCLMAEGLPDGHFEYVAGLEVRDEAQVPEGMVLRKVPAHKYAVFAHRGAMDGLRETYAHIYQDWMPQSGLEIATPAMDMEVYTEEFKDFAPDSVFYIYVAVK